MIVESINPTPILSERDFVLCMSKDDVVLDQFNLFRPLEMIAFKGSIFKVVNTFLDSKQNQIYQILYKDYPSSKPFIKY